MFALIGSLLGLVGVVCWIILLVAAFSDNLWKGLAGLCCGIYLIYYGLVEFQHPQKSWIVGGYLLGFVIGGGWRWILWHHRF